MRIHLNGWNIMWLEYNTVMEVSKQEWQKHGSETVSVSDFISGLRTRARLLDIIDGDTIVCVIPLLGHFFKYHVRLSGIDTCEMKSKDPVMKQKAIEARNYLVEALCGGDSTRKDTKQILEESCTLVFLHCYNSDKYGRLLADVFRISDEKRQKSLSTELIECHLAYAYDGGKKDPTSID